MVAHMLLFRPVFNSPSSSAHQETIQKGLGIIQRNVILHDNRDFRAPNKRYSSIIQIIQSICVAKVVLNQDDVFCFLTEQA